MINYTDIENNILLIEAKYNDPSTTTHEQILYSKLAVLEFCGWIEESFDQILKDYSLTKVSVVNQRYVDTAIIRKNYGFEYDSNTRPMFCRVLGIKNLEDMESILDDGRGVVTILKSLLSNYTTKRNDAAHKSTPLGTTLSYFAPSTVLGDFRSVKPIFLDLEMILSAI